MSDERPIESGSGARGHSSRGRVTLFRGTPAETKVQTARQIVRGDARFVSTDVSGIGPTDAHDLRRKAQGKEPAVPFRVRAAQARERVDQKIRDKKAERRGENNAAGVTGAEKLPTGEYAELGLALAQFDDDPETQERIAKKWLENRRKRAATAAKAEKAPA